MTDPARPPVPNRSAGRIEDELWLPFLAACRAEGITNTEAFRRMIRAKLDGSASGASPGTARPR